MNNRSSYMVRPLKYPTVAELEEAIEKFFQHCEETGEIPLVEGMARYLHTNVQTILNYQGRTDYAHVVENAKLRIANGVLQRGLRGDINPTLTIFISKNHYDYGDQREYFIKNEDVSTKVEKPKTPINERIADLINNAK